MKKKFFQQKTDQTKYSARYVETFAVNLPVEKINLYEWITEMTDADYISYSPAHKAMGSFFGQNKFQMTNVENIGTDTLVQHYELKYYEPNHLQLYSAKSKAYIMRWIPVRVGVPWELYLQPVSSTSSRLICMIGVDFPNLALKFASWLTSLGGLVFKKHLLKEGSAFASDIEEKFRVRVAKRKKIMDLL